MSCTKHQTNSSEFNDFDSICCDPPSDILDLQPYDNISSKDIQEVKNNITTFMSNYTPLTVEILPNKKLFKLAPFSTKPDSTPASPIPADITMEIATSE